MIKINPVLRFPLIICSIAFSACNIAPGSYPYAEEYRINVPESALVEAVNKFKTENQIYIVPPEVGLTDGRRDNHDFWYHIYFYYPGQNSIVKCWTRPVTKNKTTFAFIAINSGLALGNWKMINEDFSDLENERQKAFFEEHILNKIKKICNHKS
jgi:hypothetical protein